MTFKDYVIIYEYDKKHPTCKCGCSKEVSFFGGKFMLYLDHHQPRYGMTDKTRKKISESQKGKKQTKESNQKRSVATKQQHERNPQLAIDTSKRFSNVRKSQEHCEKISKTRKKLFEENKLMISREKISDAITKKYLEGGFEWSRGTYESTKTGNTIHYRSSLELKFAKLLDADPNVKTWEYEWESIHYQFEGKTRRYIPDFHVEMIDGTHRFVEVKPKSLTETPMNVAKREASLKICKERNWQYESWS